ncbi:MAG: 1-acyl-sn-glycerol-3-phosphate acyltransferase [Parachlamydiales bacterium]|nr:1-acyl-sn-glycerol-3-phosphate acyltransferase [Parachlamydiales bacterium]
MSSDLIIKKIEKLYNSKILPKKYFDILENFYLGYKDQVKKVISEENIYNIFNTLIDLILDQFKSPFIFDPYHQKVTKPFDYQKFGLDFVRPLIDFENSKLFGEDNLQKIAKQLDNNENVILFANHQSELDPQAIGLLLGNKFKKVADEMIFVAGERVLTDPLAIPFSMGCNLLCIFSKRYIDIDPKLQHQKQIHNKKVMTLMSDLLHEGGKVIYVAPSGGRDRKDENKKIQIAEFDPQSLEMFYLMCKKAKTPTHFYPLTLSTYEIAPPPEKIQIDLGEKRIVKRGSIFISFSKEIDMEKFLGSETADKIERRKNRAKYLHSIVKEEYRNITKG